MKVWGMAAVAALSLGACAASAATVTDSFSFSANGFSSAFGQSVPVDPVIGSVTITFDPTQTYYNEATGITLNNLNITLDSTALVFNYSPTAQSFADGSALLAGEVIIGADGDAALVQTSPTTANDFYVHIYDALTAPLMQQLGYTQTGLGAQAYFFTPTSEPITVTPVTGGGGGNGGVPEPATWALMLTGFSALGMALRRRRGALA